MEKRKPSSTVCVWCICKTLTIIITSGVTPSEGSLLPIGIPMIVMMLMIVQRMTLTVSWTATINMDLKRIQVKHLKNDMR